MSLMQDQIEALQQAIAEEKKREPMCEAEVKWDASAPVLITPHPNFYKRPWVGLTDEEIEAIYEQEGRADVVLLTQAKLQEKNYG